MVLGISSKSSRRGSSIQVVDYLIHIHDIKPWPPSQSLRSLRSVLIQWENGDRNSGTTNVVAPSLGSLIGQGQIDFNQSFKLPVTFSKDSYARNKGGGDVFFKNILELNLYEHRREKTHQLLATASIDLADYGILKDTITVTAPMNSKRTYRNTAQPVLYLTIQPIHRRTSSTRAKDESVSALMNHEYCKESEIDDDISSHSSSLAVSSSTTLESNGVFSLPTEEEEHEHEHERVNKNSKWNGHQRSQSASESRRGGAMTDHIPSRTSSIDLSSVFNHLPVDIPDSDSSLSTLNNCANDSSPKSMPFQIDNSQQLIISDQESRKVKSVRSSLDIAQNNSRLGRKEAKVHPNCTTLEVKVNDLESRVKMLEGELREAAAIEGALYSVVAEHGSSSTKVHAPARRLFRLYLHAHLSRRPNAAKSVVSGLVLVSKACGNDVPRLTFWLSNTIILRATITDTTTSTNNSAEEEEELPVSSAGPGPRRRRRVETEKRRSSFRWKEKDSSIESFGSWDDPLILITALEKVEAWIFSRIVESIWWQTLTPCMQSSAATSSSAREFDDGSASNKNKSFGTNQEQGDFSLQLWKKAFTDAHRRLCPLRANGHECGCLPVAARLVMEQCVTRLDVAMFNAILRDSHENLPTDPISDPIADIRVLPIPCTSSSFGSGAQLKNSIGNWSRWLSDLFGIDDDDENSNVDDDRSFKTFNFLKALSDLMMLPKDMLLNTCVRKEVCPMIGAPLIKRVLNHFVPDEFCPDAVPDAVLEALESEEEAEEEAAMFTTYPCTAPPLVYYPPSGTSISNTVGDFGQPQAPHMCRIRSSVTRKAYTSDDELDELSSPLAVVLLLQHKDSNGGEDETVRYQLLRECWTKGE